MLIHDLQFALWGALPDEISTENIFTKALPKTRVQMVSDSYIGIEVEVERVPERIKSTFWKAIEDGSLRNDGREYITPPIKATQAPTALSELRYSLSRWNRFYDFSSRTSVHIHLNIRSLTVEQLTNLILLYSVFERGMYKFVGRNRDKSIFCVPLEKSAKRRVLGGLLRLDDDCKTPHEYRSTALYYIGMMSKYSGLNLKPITSYGTIEFRHMGGTIDEDKILNWINIILSLEVMAKKIGTKDLLDMVFNLNTSSQYSMFVSDVMGIYSYPFLYPEYEKDMYDCILFLKELMASGAINIDRSKLRLSDYASKQKKGV